MDENWDNIAFLPNCIPNSNPRSGDRKSQPCQLQVANNRVHILRAAGKLREWLLEVREDQKDWYLKSEHKLCPNPWLTIILDMHMRPKGAHQKGRQKLEGSLHLKDSMASWWDLWTSSALAECTSYHIHFKWWKVENFLKFRCQREELRAEGVTGNLEPHSKGIRERMNPKILV